MKPTDPAESLADYLEEHFVYWPKHAPARYWRSSPARFARYCKKELIAVIRKHFPTRPRGEGGEVNE